MRFSALLLRRKIWNLWHLYLHGHLTDFSHRTSSKVTDPCSVLGPQTHMCTYTHTEEKFNSHIILFYEIETNSTSSGDTWVVHIHQSSQEVSCRPQRCSRCLLSLRISLKCYVWMSADRPLQVFSAPQSCGPPLAPHSGLTCMSPVAIWICDSWLKYTFLRSIMIEIDSPLYNLTPSSPSI